MNLKNSRALPPSPLHFVLNAMVGLKGLLLVEQGFYLKVTAFILLIIAMKNINLMQKRTSTPLLVHQSLQKKLKVPNQQIKNSF